MKNVFVGLSVVLALSACSSDSADYILNDSAFCSGKGNNETMICKDKNNKQINGHIIEYFPSGKIHRDFSIKDGIPDGIAKVFYENGKQKQQMNYKSGKLEGPARAWYANGKIQSEHNYKNGKYHGIRKEFDENGILRDEMNYKDGKWDGIRKEYSANGKISMETNYKDGILDGTSRAYNKNGKLYKEILKNADDTSIQTEYEYNEYGILTSKVEYDDFKEKTRKNTPKLQIAAQCEKYVSSCKGNSLTELKPGCKTEISQSKIVSKNTLGIQLETMPNVIIKTNRDYKVGDTYVPSGYVEYIKPHTYRVLNSFNTQIDVYEFKETNMPICK